MAAQLSNTRGALANLASKVSSAVQPAAKIVEKEVGSRYAKLIEANKQYVVEDQAKADLLLKQWYYTKLARYYIDALDHMVHDASPPLPSPPIIASTPPLFLTSTQSRHAPPHA